MNTTGQFIDEHKIYEIEENRKLVIQNAECGKMCCVLCIYMFRSILSD